MKFKSILRDTFQDIIWGLHIALTLDFSAVFLSAQRNLEVYTRGARMIRGGLTDDHK
ncbi:hypothetical protein M413DRAFT_443859 [Hebeloma cylindrosporum]|uniref:Uncharacterized protein n=1 Tax=Hebeloma cylindrosporum TaxID=76867 RepID=A0A0C2YPS7_HEBCY|nr:hypothetical protein M413DRAFT_443859 [Hebeloma cylindrosporum h7]